MFDISVLKEMKLPELQEIAKSAKTIKFNGVKKEVLIAQILAHQVDNASSVGAEMATDDKPKRARIAGDKKPAIRNKNRTETLFSEIEQTPQTPQTPTPISIPEEASTEKNEPKVIRFKKSDYEKKLAGKAVKVKTESLVAAPDLLPATSPAQAECL